MTTNEVRNSLAARFRGVVWACSTRAALALSALLEMACSKKTQQEYKTQQPEHGDREHARILVLETYSRYRVFSLGPRSPSLTGMSRRTRRLEELKRGRH